MSKGNQRFNESKGQRIQQRMGRKTHSAQDIELITYVVRMLCTQEMYRIALNQYCENVCVRKLS